MKCSRCLPLREDHGLLIERAVGEVGRKDRSRFAGRGAWMRCGNARPQSCPQLPQSSTGAEIDGVMRSGGWSPQKATVCQPSASTGATVLHLERGACAEQG